MFYIIFITIILYYYIYIIYYYLFLVIHLMYVNRLFLQTDYNILNNLVNN